MVDKQDESSNIERKKIAESNWFVGDGVVIIKLDGMLSDRGEQSYVSLGSMEEPQRDNLLIGCLLEGALKYVRNIASSKIVTKVKSKIQQGGGIPVQTRSKGAPSA
ncbi:OLC1v1000896C1 [Oldenlandia corymbosa var. corymbosa]|uniref:OLC1v1000896C1 n=1 Tax=Oldenlandia corymbosa var. corymbosa TaxID=529605 RepID=A0AAV1D4V4_OLDCO|nr:OLC1v1000896C1 [Oldenlandia corymbosa var. corymbosa]